MSRTKGSTAQAGAPRWRQQPERDLNAHPQDPSNSRLPLARAAREAAAAAQAGQNYPDPFAAGHGQEYAEERAPGYFPQHAFRQVAPERHAAALGRGPYTQQYEPPPSQQPQAPGLQESLGQRLQHTQMQQRDTHGRGNLPPWPAHPDTSAYDMAHYAPEQAVDGDRSLAHDPYAAQAGYAAADGWTGGGWNGQGEAYDPHMDAAGGYGDQFAGDYAADPHGDGGAGMHDDAYDFAEDEVRPRRGPRASLVVGALVGAMFAGGGLAYAYKQLGSGAGDGATPVVHADKTPAKTKPDDPGGKDIAHTDKKFLNRLGDDRATSSTRFADAKAALESDGAKSDEPDSLGGPRKVTTLVVNRDGSMAPPNPVVPVPEQSARGSMGSGVPGMLVEGLNSGAQQNGPQRPMLRGMAPSEQKPDVPAKPQVISRVETAEREPARHAPKPPARRDETRTAAATPAREAAPAPKSSSPPVSSAGYVPVLSSQRSRMDALKVFADIQQKYTDVLQSRTPDVREVDLGRKGVWHRLVLGPPGSRQAASNVCTQLKAHGYSSCWITAY